MRFGAVVSTGPVPCSCRCCCGGGSICCGSVGCCCGICCRSIGCCCGSGCCCSCGCCGICGCGCVCSSGGGGCRRCVSRELVVIRNIWICLGCHLPIGNQGVVFGFPVWCIVPESNQSRSLSFL